MTELELDAVRSIIVAREHWRYLAQEFNRDPSAGNFAKLLDLRGVRKLSEPHDRSGWRRVIPRQVAPRPEAPREPSGRYTTGRHRYVATAGDDAAFAELAKIRGERVAPIVSREIS